MTKEDMSDEWESIETAPRDGTTFLAHGTCGFSLVTYQRPYKPARRWCIAEEQLSCGTYDTLTERFITHWMPLPLPPPSVARKI